MVAIDDVDDGNESNTGLLVWCWLLPAGWLGGVSLDVGRTSLVHPNRGDDYATQGEISRQVFLLIS